MLAKLFSSASKSFLLSSRQQNQTAAFLLLNGWKNNNRNFHTSRCVLDIFKIQDENDFKEKVLDNSSKKLVILDFFATWCGPCTRLTPRLETLIGTKGAKVDLAKVDVDELDSLAAEYQVTSIPAVFAIKNGKIVDQFVGSRDDDQLNSFIDGALEK